MISYPIRLFNFIHLAFSFLSHIIHVTVTQQFILPITFYMSIENAEKKQLRLSKRYWYAHRR